MAQNSLNNPAVLTHLRSTCYLLSDWNSKRQGQLCGTQGITPAKNNELGIFIASLDMETNTLTECLNNWKIFNHLRKFIFTVKLMN